jgi:phosphate:Na+ symporter
MASQGLLQLEAAIAIALGANVGTCVTAGLASIGKPREAVRAAVAHTVFNVTGVLLWIGFIPQLAAFAVWISPVAEGLTGADKLAAEAPRQIANVHTFFNVINALVFIGFTPQLARLVVWLVPPRPYVPEKAMLPKYLDEDLLGTPAIALEAARQEINRLGKRVRKMVRVGLPVALTGRRGDLEEITAMDKVVDARHLAIIEFLGQISLAKLTKRQSRELMQLAEAANSLEHIGDRIATGLVTSARKRIDEEVHISEQTAEVISEYHQLVYRTLCDALKSIARQDNELAARVKKRKKDVARLSDLMTAHGLDRLTADEPNRLRTYAREMELVEILDDIFNVSRRLAQSQTKMLK